MAPYIMTLREEMKEMKYFLEKEFNKVTKRFDQARQEAIGDVITELRGDLSNSIQFLTSIEARIYTQLNR